MGAQAHHKISVDVFGAIDTAWVITSHYCDEGSIGERSVCKRVREEAATKGVKLAQVSARFVAGIGWDARAEAVNASIVRLRPIGRGYAEVLVGLSETTLASVTGAVPVAMAERYAAAQTSGDRVAGDAAAEEIDTWRDGLAEAE